MGTKKKVTVYVVVVEERVVAGVKREHEVGKFFSREDAEAHVADRALHAGSWGNPRVVDREELEEDQHPSHRGAWKGER